MSGGAHRQAARRVVLVVVLVVVAVAVGLVAWITGRALPADDAARSRSPACTAPVDGRPRRERDRPHHRRHARTTCSWPRATSTPRSGCGRWRSGATSRAGRLSRAVRREPARHGPLHPDARLAAGGRSATSTALSARTPGASSTPTPTGVNAWLDGHRGASAWRSSSRRSAARRRLGGYARSRGRPSTRWPGPRSRPGTSAATSTPRSSGCLADARLGDPARTDELFPAYRRSAPVITPSGLPGSRRRRRDRRRDRPARRAVGATSATAPAATARRRPQARGLARRRRPRATGSSRSPGSTPRDGLAVGPRHRLEQLGRRRRRSRRPAARCSPTTRTSASRCRRSGIMNGLHCRRRRRRPAPTTSPASRFPGAPGVVLGHNARIAWGATNVDPDVQDLFDRDRRPGRPGRLPARRASRSRSTIRARDDQGRRRRRRHARGPRDRPRPDPQRRRRPPRATRRRSPCAGRRLPEPDRTLEAILGLDTAARLRRRSGRRSSTLRRARRRTSSTPTSTATSATSCPGAIPIRTDPATPALRPVRGGDGRARVDGLRSRSTTCPGARPAVRLIVTANNAAGRRATTRTSSARSGTPATGPQRIIDLLDGTARTALTADELGAIQMDTHRCGPGTGIVPADLAPAAAPSTGRWRADPRRGSPAWDGACDVDSLGCAAYMACEYRVLRDIFDDELGPLARDYVGTDVSWLVARSRSSTTRPARGGTTRRPPAAWRRRPTIVAAGARRGRRRAARRRSATRRAGPGAGSTPVDASGRPTLGQQRDRAARVVLQRRARSPVAGAAGRDRQHLLPDSRRAYPDPTTRRYVPVGIDGVFDVTNGPSLPARRSTWATSTARGSSSRPARRGNPFDRHYGDLIDDWLNGRHGAAALLAGRGRGRGGDDADPDAVSGRPRPSAGGRRSSSSGPGSWAPGPRCGPRRERPANAADRRATGSGASAGDVRRRDADHPRLATGPTRSTRAGRARRVTAWIELREPRSASRSSSTAGRSGSPIARTASRRPRSATLALDGRPGRASLAGRRAAARWPRPADRRPGVRGLRAGGRAAHGPARRWPPSARRFTDAGGGFELACASGSARAAAGGCRTSSPTTARGSPAPSSSSRCGPWLPRLFPELVGDAHPGDEAGRRVHRAGRGDDRLRTRAASHAGSTTTPRSTASRRSTGGASRSRPTRTGRRSTPTTASGSSIRSPSGMARRYLARRIPDLADATDRRDARLPVRDHAGHPLRHRPPPRLRQRLARGRRLGPRLQARPGDRPLRRRAAVRRSAGPARRPGRRPLTRSRDRPLARGVGRQPTRVLSGRLDRRGREQHRPA